LVIVTIDFVLTGPSQKSPACAPIVVLVIEHYGHHFRFFRKVLREHCTEKRSRKGEKWYPWCPKCLKVGKGENQWIISVILDNSI